VTSHRLQKALQQRREAINTNRLKTIPFVSVEEYLGKLEVLCRSLTKSAIGSMGLIYLAAAVSDYYIPK